MRVEVVCSSREIFGADRSAVRLASLLQGLGLDARLAVPSARPERGLGELAAAAGLEVAVTPVLVVSSRGADGLGALAPGREPSGAELTIYNSSAVVSRAGDRRPRALVVREWLRPGSPRHRALAAVHARRVRGVVAVSAGVADGWRACAGGRVPVEVGHNWLEQEWLAPTPDREQEGVLFVGRLNAWKGQGMLADAFELAFAGARRRPSLTFVGAEGPGSPFHRNAELLRRRCERSGWRLLELTPQPREVIERSALVVVPSLRPEPFGNVTLEALASGARVLAFGGGGVDDLAPLFRDALTVVERDRAALAAELERWWAAGGEAQAAADRPRVLQTLAERFSAAAAAPRWQRLVERLAPA